MTQARPGSTESPAGARSGLPARLLATRHPAMLELNARVFLNHERERLGSPLHLGQLPDTCFDAIAARGFDLVWLMGVWTTGDRSRQIAGALDGLRRAYDRALPGWTGRDVVGSPYAIRSYTASPELGGEQALQAFRRRLHRRGIGLILDFVPNHTALDHDWVYRRPELYVQFDPHEADARPHECVVSDTARGLRAIAHGRDPYFPPWTDTAQLNILQPALRDAHRALLNEIAGMCDGVRCDMAMLALSEVFERTWGAGAGRPIDTRPAPGEYWDDMIGATRRTHPAFIFVGEVYWDLEARILDLGFDYVYDKALYDRLRYQGPAPVQAHLEMHPSVQARMLRFLENHDEERAAAAFSDDRLKAALTTTYTLPGLRLFHDGQLEGYTRQLPVQLGRRHPEPVRDWIPRFYDALLDAIADPIFRLGSWGRLEVRQAWEGNPSAGAILAHRWDGGLLGQRLVIVNLGDHQAQGRVRIARAGLGGRRLRLRDLIGAEAYVRSRDELTGEGLYLDLEPYQAHIFTLETCD